MLGGLLLKRYEELDSLRGLAALVVFISHYLFVLPIGEKIHGSLLMYTPIRVLSNGHTSVILFFVLSGFVLSLPFYKNTNFIIRIT